MERKIYVFLWEKYINHGKKYIFLSVIYIFPPKKYTNGRAKYIFLSLIYIFSSSV